MTRRPDAGFTLLELMIALAIVGALLVVAFGGLRVALSAWRQGEDRADVHQHARGLAVTLARAIGASYPYKGPLRDLPEAVLMFSGTGDRVQFVTQAPPFPFSLPIAFTAVVVALETGDEPGLVVRERALPNFDPFTKAEVVYRDAAVTALDIKYLDDSGAWRDDWDATRDNAIPRAVRISLGTTVAGRARALPPITVSVRAVPAS